MNDEKIINEKTILVGIVQDKKTEYLISEYLDELELLANAAGAEVIGRVTQKISKINPATYIGQGKAKQLIKQAKELNVKVISQSEWQKFLK